MYNQAWVNGNNGQSMFGQGYNSVAEYLSHNDGARVRQEAEAAAAKAAAMRAYTPPPIPISVPTPRPALPLPALPPVRRGLPIPSDAGRSSGSSGGSVSKVDRFGWIEMTIVGLFLTFAGGGAFLFGLVFGAVKQFMSYFGGPSSDSLEVYYYKIMSSIEAIYGLAPHSKLLTLLLVLLYAIVFLYIVYQSLIVVIGLAVGSVIIWAIADVLRGIWFDIL